MKSINITQEQFFMLSMLLVNGGNYLYNLFLGRFLGPEDFSDAAILITFLLVLSFVGMTFQVVTAKYVVLFETNKQLLFVRQFLKYAVGIGILFAIIFLVFQDEFQILLGTKTNTMFGIFALGLPLYFLMSVNRGNYQGKNELNKLSFTYILEMISRLGITVGLLYLMPTISPSITVALGIVFSFVFGLFPIKNLWGILSEKLPKVTIAYKEVVSFFMIMAFYELTQIIINNSDIILVKSYFSAHEAGLYASLALIGRVVYFVAWMFVMLLLPKIIALHKDGKPTFPLLFKNVVYIGILSVLIVGVTYFFPEIIVRLLFGDAYLAIASLLWKYAFATSLFALSNIFAYYFLSVNQYVPVVISAVLGCSQIGLILLYHQSLEQVVLVQIAVMAILLVVQLLFFIYQYYQSIRLNK